MDLLHASVDSVKLEKNPHLCDTGGLNNGMSEPVHSMSMSQVKLENDSGVGELSLSEFINDEVDSKSFQEELTEEKKIWTKDFILPKSWTSEDDHLVSLNEVKLEDDSIKEEPSFSECGNDDKDSKNFQDEFIDGEKIWKREDFILQESGRTKRWKFLVEKSKQSYSKSENPEMEEPMENFEPFSKEVAVQANDDTVAKIMNMENEKNHLESKVKELTEMLNQKSIVIKKIRKQNSRLNVRFSSMEALVRKHLHSEHLMDKEFQLHIQNLPDIHKELFLRNVNKVPERDIQHLPASSSNSS